MRGTSRAFILGLGLLLAGCAGRAAAPGPEPVRTLVYRCDGGVGVVAQVQGETAWLLLPGRTAELTQVPAASGARYEATDLLFWSRGEEALIEAGGQVFSGCVNRPGEAAWEDARLRGVDFRAVGSEPGWLLEITPARLRLNAAYGERRLEFPGVEPEFDLAARRTRYRSEQGGQRLTVTIVGRPCRDLMSGEAFPAAVTVELEDGTVLRGCGRPLH
jgi:putative lipoprotein